MPGHEKEAPCIRAVFRMSTSVSMVFSFFSILVFQQGNYISYLHSSQGDAVLCGAILVPRATRLNLFQDHVTKKRRALVTRMMRSRVMIRVSRMRNILPSRTLLALSLLDHSTFSLSAPLKVSVKSSFEFVTAAE